VSGIGALVTAQEMLARRAARAAGGAAGAAGAPAAAAGAAFGLAATLQLAPPDGEADREKRSIRKLVVACVPAPPPDPSDWSGPGDRTSTSAVRGAADLAAALRAGLAGPRGGHALEARGEQGVNRALRAVLALQAELGEPLAVWPWYGAVGGGGGGGADGDAAEGGGAAAPRLVPGTVLLVRRCEG
jgi:hypothetical protein